MIYLYQIAKYSEVWLDEGTKVLYRHTDGHFSFCSGLEDDKGKEFNLPRLTPLVKVEDHYEINDETQL